MLTTRGLGPEGACPEALDLSTPLVGICLVDVEHDDPAGDDCRMVGPSFEVGIGEDGVERQVCDGLVSPSVEGRELGSGLLDRDEAAPGYGLELDAVLVHLPGEPDEGVLASGSSELDMAASLTGGFDHPAWELVLARGSPEGLGVERELVSLGLTKDAQVLVLKVLTEDRWKGIIHLATSFLLAGWDEH